MKWLGLLKGSGTIINDEQALVLSGLRGLKFLDLGGCRLTGQGVQSLTSLTALLTTLNLTWCDLISDQGVQSLASLTALTTLNLSGCRLISDQGVHVQSLVLRGVAVAL